MTDITKCHGTDSPLCETCYRKLAPQHEYWQAWFMAAPIQDGTCDKYWEWKVRDVPDA